jgi:hypothetical protein
MCTCLRHFPFLFFFFYDAICIGENNFLELGQASKSGGGGGGGGGQSTCNLMALVSTLSLEDFIAKCSMDISKLQEDVKVVEDQIKVMEER